MEHIIPLKLFTGFIIVGVSITQQRIDSREILRYSVRIGTSGVYFCDLIQIALIT